MIYYELILLEIGNSPSNTVTAIRLGSQLQMHLKDVEDIVNSVRDGNEKILYDGSDFNKVLSIMKELDEVGAEYEMHNYY